MSRRPRLKLDGVPIHIIQRGNNRNACFYADEYYQFYLESLDAKRKRDLTHFSF
jgi:putative transposase